MKFARLIVGFAALSFLGFGVAFLVAPDTLIASVDLSPTSPVGLTELRAFYGGLEIGLAVYLISCLLGDRRDLISGTSVTALSMGAVALARAWGMWVDGTAGSAMAGFMATELLLAGLALIARQRLRTAI